MAKAEVVDTHESEQEPVDAEVVELPPADWFENQLKARLNDLVAAVKVPTNEAEAKRLPVIVEALRDLNSIQRKLEWQNRDHYPPPFDLSIVSDKALSKEVKRRKAERAK